MNKLKNILTIILCGGLIFTLSISCFVKEDTLISDSERRELKQKPELNIDSLISGEFMKNFEDYTLDQFPMRDEFRTIKALSEFNIFGKLDVNKLYMQDGYISKMEYPMNTAMLDHASNCFNSVHDKFLKDADNIYLSIVPDKNYFLSQQDYLGLDYNELVAYMQQKNSYAKYIDVFPTLSLEDYYKTDTHWRQEKITDTAKLLADNLGVTIPTDYKTNTATQDFKGVYNGQLPISIDSEDIKYLTNDIIDQMEVGSIFTGTKYVRTQIYDFEKLEGKDKYDFFLSGPVAIQKIVNKNATSDKELIVFRDSFGSSIIPLIAQGYKTVYVIDIRYIGLETCVSAKGKDVLFLYSTVLLNSSLALKEPK